MIVDNRKIIRDVNSALYNRLLQTECKQVIIEPGKKEGKTLALFIEGKKMYLNSKYNPIQEAVNFTESLTNVEKAVHILFVGTGIGYHIIEILHKNPKIKYSIYEPNLEVLASFLSTHNLSKVKAQLIEVFTNIDEVLKFSEFANLYVSKGIVVRWTPTLKICESQILGFEKRLAETLKELEFSKGINAAHQQRWQLNGLFNFSKILKTPHIFDTNSTVFENKPVVIVAAGPSLSFDIEYIREIQVKKRAYIFAVGSAINALIEKDIIPDVFVSFDPKVGNNPLVFKKLKEKKLSIPLFFGSTIGHETLEDYPGEMFHFFVGQETISSYFLDIQPNRIFSDKPSVAVQALEICARLKMGPIILAGQNCAFLNNKRYADEIDYTHVSKELTEQEQQKLIEVENVDGDIVYTSRGNYELLSSLEAVIRNYKLDNIVNTTKQGAKIEGAPFIEMGDILATKLVNEYVVAEDWTKATNSYEIVEVLKRYEYLENSFDELFANIKAVLEICEKVIEKNNINVYGNLMILLREFDGHYHSINNNTFFKTVIKPMIRFQNQEFLLRLDEMKVAKNDKVRAEKFREIHVPYMKAILANIVVVQEAFKELQQIKQLNGNGAS